MAIQKLPRPTFLLSRGRNKGVGSLCSTAQGQLRLPTPLSRLFLKQTELYLLPNLYNVLIGDLALAGKKPKSMP